MQAFYRGIAYQTATFAIEATETFETRLFLGNRFAIKRYRVKKKPSATIQLRYRGVDYIR